jgi:hypothetical protein
MAEPVRNMFDQSAPGKASITSGGGGTHDGEMSERLAKIEAMLPTLATKSDLASVGTSVEAVRGDIKGWMLATVLTIIAAIVGLGTFMRPSAPMSQQPAQQVPIIVQVPAYIPMSAPATSATVAKGTAAKGRR